LRSAGSGQPREAMAVKPAALPSAAAPLVLGDHDRRIDAD
jgi:hypothetical protein